MATTAAGYQDVAKEVWDSDTMAKQFYDENPWLDRLQKSKRVVIGKRAQVPIHRGRAGGTTVLDAAGGTINTADSEDVDQAQYNVAYNYFPVEIQVGALNEITGGQQSVGDALEHMMSSGINNIRNQVSRQFLTGHGRVASCDTGGASATIELSTSATAAGEVSGKDAVQLGWLVPGDVVSVGTVGDPDSLINGETITAVKDDNADPDITVSTSVSTTSGTHFVVLGNGDGAGTTLESAGLVTIAGTTGNTVGAISGTTDSYWNPAEVDTTSTLPDLELLLRLNRATTRRSGKSGSFVLTSLKQLDNIYSFLQSQVRFAGDRGLGAGGSETVQWRGMEIHAFPQVPENLLFFLNLEDLEIVTGKYSKPTWMSDIEGGGRLHWTPGQTKFSDTVMFALGLAARRRNTSAAATKLTA